MAAVYSILHLSTWFDNLFDEALIIWFQVNILLGSKYISNTSLNFPTFLSIAIILIVVMHHTLLIFSNIWSFIVI